jgi:hypothetical protein
MHWVPPGQSNPLTFLSLLEIVDFFVLAILMKRVETRRNRRSRCFVFDIFNSK